MSDTYTAGDVSAPARFWLDVQALIWPGDDTDAARRRLERVVNEWVDA